MRFVFKNLKSWIICIFFHENLHNSKKSSTFAADSYVNTRNYSVKLWFLIERHCWITLWSERAVALMVHKIGRILIPMKTHVGDKV